MVELVKTTPFFIVQTIKKYLGWKLIETGGLELVEAVDIFMQGEDSIYNAIYDYFNK